MAQVRIARAATALALAVGTASASGAGAQTLQPTPVKPVVDANGVDVVNWTYTLDLAPISIGPSDQDPIKLSINWPTERDSFYSNLRIEDPSWVTSTRGSATIGLKTWSILGWGVSSDPGAQFWMGTDSAFIMDRDGTLIEYDYPDGFFQGSSSTVHMCAAKITKPNGEVLTYHLKDVAGGCRVQSIVSSRGYQIKYEYYSTAPTARSKIILINNAYEYCNPTADTCSLAMPWPYVTMPLTPVNGARIYSNHLSQSWTLTASQQAGSLLSPGESTPGLQWTTQSYLSPTVIGSYEWRVTSMSRGGQTWLYSYPSSDPVLGSTANTLLRVQDPLGKATRYRRVVGMSGGDPNTGEFDWPHHLYKAVDELGNVSTNIYSYSPSFALTETHLPEGNKEVVTYDGSGNVLTNTLHPKPGSGLASIVRGATYSCVFTCNSPATTTDARNNTTSYTYSPTHGGILTETSPPDASGLQAVKRYAYVQRHAWVKNSSGGYSQAATPVWLLDSEKTCKTSATVNGNCAAGATDEVTVSYDYGPDSGPNNLWIRGKIVTADGVSRRACFGYDAVGNKISETKPRAALTSCP